MALIFQIKHHTKRNKTADYLHIGRIKILPIRQREILRLVQMDNSLVCQTGDLLLGADFIDLGLALGRQCA